MKQAEEPSPQNLVLGRVSNATSFAFDNALLNTLDPQAEMRTTNFARFGRIDVAQQTDYVPFDQLTQFAPMRVSAGGRQYDVVFYSALPAKALAPGKYTFVVRYNATSQRLTHEMVQDN